MKKTWKKDSEWLMGKESFEEFMEEIKEDENFKVTKVTEMGDGTYWVEYEYR